MKGLLTVERMVLESINKGKNEIKIISEDTSLGEMFVRTILSNLKDYNLIKYQKGKYSLTEKVENLREFNKPQNVKHEVKDLFSSLVDNYYSSEGAPTLKMQKVWLTDFEYKVLNSYLINMEAFIKSVRKDRLLHPEEEVLAEQRIIFWGTDTYSNLINSTLNAA